MQNITIPWAAGTGNLILSRIFSFSPPVNEKSIPYHRFAEVTFL
jgi:hypothetical protein